MTEHGTADARDSAQEPSDIQREGSAGAGPGGWRTAKAGLSERQRKVMFRVIRVAYPHDRFPDPPYERTAKQVEDAAASSEEDAAALAEGLDALADQDFLTLDDDAATAALRAVDRQPFFRQIHATAVVALYDDREVWELLGYEGPSFDEGGYLERGFDDLDWLPDPRITELAEARVELATEERRA